MDKPRVSPLPYLLTAPGIIVFFTMVLVPLLLTFILSFNGFDAITGIKATYSFNNYWQVVSDEYYQGIFLRTFWVAALTTLICILIGAPEAYVLSRMRKPWRSIFLIVILAPLLVSVVVRAFGWSMLLSADGLVNTMLGWFGIPPAKLLYTTGAMVVALVHVMLPFMVIPVWTSVQRLDPAVEHAALSLNASQPTILRRIVLPQILPGILSGSLIVFGLSASAFAIPGLLGGRRLKVVATSVYDEFLGSLNWPMGASIAIILLVANLLIMLSYNRILERKYSKVLG
ncbi:ABC transporter permease [Glaciimonas sp. PCH181]|uniref:ABC transporter permease n=1 Tax=Glaciimonas sp. PCH181 TaxID=2133943 RepID=UPI000D3511CD|nr:ABC transporter permease [Glaciimonas sp. PCH181]PUA17124.1 ABC transporter permease [Glaciimonas sp. PCH181]